MAAAQDETEISTGSPPESTTYGQGFPIFDSWDDVIPGETGMEFPHKNSAAYSSTASTTPPRSTADGTSSPIQGLGFVVSAGSVNPLVLTSTISLVSSDLVPLTPVTPFTAFVTAARNTLPTLVASSAIKTSREPAPPTAVPDTSSYYTSDSPILSKVAVIGIATGSALGVLLLVAHIWVWILYRRRPKTRDTRKRERKEANGAEDKCAGVDFGMGKAELGSGHMKNSEDLVKKAGAGDGIFQTKPHRSQPLAELQGKTGLGTRG